MADKTEEVLESLRWKEDQVITNYDGDRVWLKPCFVGAVRAGITDCCLESEPCDWHKAIRAMPGEPPVG